MRIYIPAMLTDLHRFVDDETVLVRGGTAFALTPTLREQYVSDDDEQLEHIAFLDAARASLRILTGAAGILSPRGQRHGNALLFPQMWTINLSLAVLISTVQ